MYPRKGERVRVVGRWCGRDYDVLEGLRFRLASEVFQGSQDERQAAVSRVAP